MMANHFERQELKKQVPKSPSDWSRAARKNKNKNKRSTLGLLVVFIYALAATNFWPLARAVANTRTQQQVPAEASKTRSNYFGSFIGKLADRLGHSISGAVYAVDEQTIFIRDFNYDGQAADAYFWSSTSQAASTSGPSAAEGAFIVPDEKGSTKPLERYSDKDIVLRLPEGKTLREIHWLSIWSRQAKASAGDITIPRSPPLVIPRPLEIAPLTQLAHGLRSGPITIVDAQTLLVPEFHYDGLGPDAYFWMSRGSAGLNAGPGSSLKLKDENGSPQPLRKYQGETIVISLPDELTVYDFEHFGVWCRQYSVNFGQTQLPQLLASQATNSSSSSRPNSNSARVPPSPKMLGIKPENKLNCEILYDDLGFEIRWVLDGDDIVMQLVGKIEPGEYMAFGLGKDDSRSDMNNADAVVAWVDRSSGQVHAIDYFLGQTKAQCANDPKRGSCPDVRLPAGGDSLTLLHGAIVNGYSMVTFKRPQLGVDEQYDQHVYSDGQQSVIWAIGTLNAQKEIGYHRLRTKTNMFIDFARNPQWNCPIPDLNASMQAGSGSVAAAGLQPPTASASASAATTTTTTLASISPAASQLDQTVVDTQSSGALPVASASTPDTRSAPGSEVYLEDAASQQGSTPTSDAWFIPSIVCPSDRSFYAQVGPAGGVRRGLALVTSSAWYINGLMVPELILERGQTYKFIVEGGNDKTAPSGRHPMYLTDSQEGGFNFKTDEERQRERLFGGVALRSNDGQFVPTAEGRMCEWRAGEQTAQNPDVYKTFSAFQRTLSLQCAPGQASALKFAPDSSTPNELFYQCYTHRFMGGRIRVVDSCAQFMAANGISPSPAFIGQGSNSSSSGSQQRSVSNQKKRDTPKRRRSSNIQTSVGLLHDQDLSAQPSEPRMSFEQPQFGETTLVEDGTAAGEFGDEVSASSPQELLAALSPSPIILNNSQLFDNNNNQPQLNVSTLEQILKFSPSDLEFLDTIDSQSPAGSNPQHQTLDLMGALELQQQQQQQQQQQLHALLNNNQVQRNDTQAGSKNGPPRVPRGWSAYMRRLASIYYPVQQQLASILTSGQAIPVASNNGNNKMFAPNSQPVAAASSVSSASFSLASLVPKSPKMVVDGFSKANISKKFNKLRIKSGRKIEPTQQPNGSGSGSPSSSSSNNNQIRPPTPENEFNYDIFNNQLAQLERQQKQLYALEHMAAAAAAAASSSMAGLAPHQQQFASHQPNFLSLQASSSASSGELNYIHPSGDRGTLTDGDYSMQPFGGHAPGQIQSFNHYQETLQQQQSSPQQQQISRPRPAQLQYTDQQINNNNINNNNMNIRPSSYQQYNPTQQQQQQQVTSNGTRWTNNDQEQQAVFVTRLPIPPTPHHHYLQQHWSETQQQQQQRQQQHHHNQPYEGLGHQSAGGDIPRPQVTYVDATNEYSPQQQLAMSQDSMSSNEIMGLQQHRPSAGISYKQQQQQQLIKDPLDSSTSTTSTTSSSSAVAPSSNNNDPDHMLAIERYSKQSSERRAPSVAHPITGELVSSAEQFHHEQEPTYMLQYTLGTSNNHNNNSNRNPSSHRTEADKQRPRYSSVLIDQNTIAPTTPSLNEPLDAEQSVQAADLKRLNATNVIMASQESPSYVIRTSSGPTNNGGNNNNNNNSTRMQTTSESSIMISPVLTRPPSSSSLFTSSVATSPTFDFFASDPPATTMAAISLLAPSSSTMASIAATGPSSSTASSGPLVPSIGPPVMHKQQHSNQDADSALVFQTNLIEPITSTLVPETSRYYTGNNLMPFRPVELMHASASQQPLHYSNLLQSEQRAQGPPRAPNMMSDSLLNPFRPEPPVQVASYLSQQLAAQLSSSSNDQRFPLSNERSAGSSQPLSITIPVASNIIASTTSHQNNNNNSNNSRPVDLIILKPSPIRQNLADNEQYANRGLHQGNTYSLRPEFLSTGQLGADGNSRPFRPMIGDSQIILENPNGQSDLMYDSSNNRDAANRRLAGHLFERISSLSSPPSTSMVLDPMQTSNSMTNLNFNKPLEQQETTRVSSQLLSQSVSDNKQNNSNSSTIRHIPGRLLPTLEQPKVGISAAEQGDLQLMTARDYSSLTNESIKSSSNNNANLLYRDNNTDNAILSHVMSLISANAIPAPPVVPVSSYSSADYFLPISDQNNSIQRLRRRAPRSAQSIR